MIHHLEVLSYILLALGLCWVGKRVYGWVHPHARVDHELTAKDNLAFAVPLGAYFLSLIIALGAPLAVATSGSWTEDAVQTAAWGLFAIALLNIASFASDRTLLRGLDAAEEVCQRENVSAGILLAGGHLANALIVLGALGGDGGLLPALAFWVYGQLWLALTARFLPVLLRCDLARQVRDDNRAVALVGAGAIVAVANVLRLAVTGPFQGWSASFAAATGYAAVGLGCLFIVRELVDRLLLPRVTIQHELLEQAKPNAGVGYLVGLFYVGISVLVGWCL